MLTYLLRGDALKAIHHPLRSDGATRFPVAGADAALRTAIDSAAAVICLLVRGLLVISRSRGHRVLQ